MGSLGLHCSEDTPEPTMLQPWVRILTEDNMLAMIFLFIQINDSICICHWSVKVPKWKMAEVCPYLNNTGSVCGAVGTSIPLFTTRNGFCSSNPVKGYLLFNCKSKKDDNERNHKELEKFPFRQFKKIK